MINDYEKKIDIQRLSVSKIINIIYLTTVILLGMSYVWYSKGGNLGTIMAFASGDRSIHIEALIYSSMFELIFEMFSIYGSGFCLYRIIIKNETKVIPKVLIHLLTVTFYVLSRIALVQGVIHISTQGAIKNIEMWDFRFISSNILGSNATTYKGIYLLAGLIIFLVFREKSNEHKLID